MHAIHPSSIMNQMLPVDENMMRFPIIQVEVKIRVPDQLIGRLIGKGGTGLKKIMDDTQSHITISESRNQQEVHQYMTPELLDRVITIRGTSFNIVIAAEKHVQQKLRQFHEQDMNISGGGAGVQQQIPSHQPQYCQTPAGPVLLNTLDNTAMGHPHYIAPTNAAVAGSMLSRDNTYTAAAYNAQCLPMGPQSFYIQQNHPGATNFQVSTGQYTQNIPMPTNLPNSVHIKSRVYVPNQIVGILIGTKGQTIKSVIAESGAIISIEGDREQRRALYQAQYKRDTASVQSSGDNKDAAVSEQQNKTEDHKSPPTTVLAQKPVEVPAPTFVAAVERNGGGDEDNNDTDEGICVKALHNVEPIVAATTDEEVNNNTNNGQNEEELLSKQTTTMMTDEGGDDGVAVHSSSEPAAPTATTAVSGQTVVVDEHGLVSTAKEASTVSSEVVIAGAETTETAAEHSSKSNSPQQQQTEAGATDDDDQQHNNNNNEQQQQRNPSTPSLMKMCQAINNGAKKVSTTALNNHQQQQTALHQGSAVERSVFIQGYDFQVAKALYWVYQKVAESQNKHPEEIVLTCEAIVPSKVIGRIIGKGGYNVKQLQQRSGAHIKVPDDINDKNCVEAAVRVIGSFFAVQTVQQHFGTLIIEAEWRESREYDERRLRYRDGSR